MNISDADFECFVLSDESASLTDAEFQSACQIIDAVELCRNIEHPSIVDPQAGWGLNGASHDFRSSFSLLMQKDREIISKMRLYSQAFSGYQLATLRWSEQYVPWVCDKLPADYDKFLPLVAGVRDRWVDSYIQIAEGLPDELCIALPQKFGEIGWRYSGRILNHDSHAYLIRIAMMYETSILTFLNLLEDKPPRVLEIGAGFGGLAYMLTRIRPGMRYVIVDLPESLVFSAIYLSVLFPEIESTLIYEDQDFEIPNTAGFTFVPTTLFHRMHYPSIDLAINTLSFAEMTTEQVIHYCRFISRNLAGMMFEQNNEYLDRKPEPIALTVSRCFRTGKQVMSTRTERMLYGPARVWVNSDDIF